MKKFCESFSVPLFDYSISVRSGREPRQLISIRRQLEDWSSVVGYAKERYDELAL